MGGQGVDGLKGRWPGGRLPLPTAPYPLSPARVEDAPWRQVMCGWPRIKQLGKVAWPRNHRELFQSRRNALKLTWPEGRKWEESPAPVALRNEELLCEYANLISCSGRLEHLSPEMSLKNKNQDNHSSEDSVKGNNQYRSPGRIPLEHEEESRKNFQQFETNDQCRPYPMVHLEP